MVQVLQTRGSSPTNTWFRSYKINTWFRSYTGKATRGSGPTNTNNWRPESEGIGGRGLFYAVFLVEVELSPPQSWTPDRILDAPLDMSR